MRLSCHQKEFDLASSDASDASDVEPCEAPAAPSTPKLQPAAPAAPAAPGSPGDDELLVISAVSPPSAPKFAFAQRCRRLAEAKSPKVKSPKVKKARLTEGAKMCQLNSSKKNTLNHVEKMLNTQMVSNL